MKITNQDKIDILTIHKRNLLKTKTFEEYRNAHVAYIDLLISQISLEKKWVIVTKTFIDSDKS